MECFFTCTTKKQLYTAYHPPSDNVDKNIGIIMCYPFGQEYMRCHKFYFKLAVKLAKNGFHVLRFDYTSSGDSSGQSEDFTLSECLDDLHQIEKDFRSAINPEKIFLFGVRFGGAVSILFSKQADINGLILISPVCKGNAHLAEMKERYSNWLKGAFVNTKFLGKTDSEISGYPMSGDFLKEIRQLDIDCADYYRYNKCLIIDKTSPAFDSNSANVKFYEIMNDKFWVKTEDEEQKKSLPNYEMDVICNWLENV